MSGKTVRLFTLSVLLMAGGMHASAETAAPSENVTVTATKSREVLGNFTKAFATPTKLTGKIARWEHRVCPIVAGQMPNFTRFITQRVKYVAVAAGAPVNTEASCTPNIEIVFTSTPQALMDNVRQHQAEFLGYAESSTQKDKLAMVTRPIQAWYTTETVDLKNRRRVDSDGNSMRSVGTDGYLTPDASMQAFNGPGVPGNLELEGIPKSASSGNRINDGIHSGFNHILIVIDSAKLAEQKIVPLADYISMLALTQLNSLDACQQLPSIVNILAADCDHAGDGLTQFDLAYLQGLYKMSAGRGLMFQRNDIANAMTDTLAKAK
jgi:hypothetical protein